jgi:hypothetical protein
VGKRDSGAPAVATASQGRTGWARDGGGRRWADRAIPAETIGPVRIPRDADAPGSRPGGYRLGSRTAICPRREKSIDSPRMRAASWGAWKPVEFSASTKSR